MKPPLLTAEDLSYGVSVPGTREEKLLVEHVHLALHENEIIGITGPNGAGKSTLLRLLSGFLAPTGGMVFYGDRMLASLKDRERAGHTSFMSQRGPDTFPFTVTEIVEMGSYASLGAARYPGKKEQAAAQEALKAVGMEDLADRSFTSLSGGEQQLVLFAQVLVQDTPVILLDEPTASLDIGHEAQLLQMVRELCREGRGALIALHNLNSAAEYCDRVLLLSKGKVVSEGTPREVFTESSLGEYYDTEVRLGTNESTGSLVVTALPRVKSETGIHIHLIGGAGSAVSLSRELYLLGCRISGGAAHELDSDAKIWNSLGSESVTVPAFAEIDQESFRKASAMVEHADITVLCSFPVGRGNKANLELAAKARRLIVIEDPEPRTFFSGEAGDLFRKLVQNSEVMEQGELLGMVRSVIREKQVQEAYVSNQP